MKYLRLLYPMELQYDNIYVYLDKDFFDMLMPLIYPLLPELDALIDGLDIKILGSPVGKYIRTMLNIESMTDLEQVWKESTVFKIGIDINFLISVKKCLSSATCTT